MRQHLDHSRVIGLLVLAGAGLAGAAGSTWSQEDPFGGGAPKAGVKGEIDPFGGAAPAAGTPAAGAPATDTTAVKGKSKGKAAEAAPLPRELERLKASQPKSAVDLVRAAQAAWQYERPEETKRYLAELVASPPTEEQLAALATRFGDFLFEVRRAAAAQPEGQQAAELILSAGRRVALDPARIDAAIAKLSDPALGVRQRALGEVVLAGTQAVNPLLGVLADSSRAAEHANVRAALVRLSRDAEGPLVGALATQDEGLRLQVIAVLGRMRSRLAVTPLIRPAVDPAGSAELRQLAGAAIEKAVGAAPDLQQGLRQLESESERLMAGELPMRADADDLVELWNWDEARRGAFPQRLAKRDAGTLLAGRVASDWRLLQPDNVEAQRRLLLAVFEHTRSQTGLGLPLPDDLEPAKILGLSAGPQLVNRVLADALAQGRIAAAITAAEILGRASDKSVLRSNPGSASPLGEAMRHPDRRVRLAAALAAVQLAPGESFAGASRVSETLGWFVGTEGTAAVLIGHPRSQDAQSLAALLRESGLDGKAVYRGRELAERAFAQPDIEFLLIADAIDGPPVVELVQWLRRDYRTAGAPIGVMARSENLVALREAVGDDPMTLVFPRLFSSEVAAREVAKLRQLAGRNLVERDERTAQALAALGALTTLAKNENNFASYQLLRLEPTLSGALNNTSLSAGAAGVLGLLGTPSAQTALVDFASQQSRQIGDRQAAAASFAAAVQRRGVLLTQVQIVQQFERYNASEKLDADTQGVLASLIDAIEARALVNGEG